MSEAWDFIEERKGRLSKSRVVIIAWEEGDAVRAAYFTKDATQSLIAVTGVGAANAAFRAMVEGDDDE